MVIRSGGEGQRASRQPMLSRDRSNGLAGRSPFDCIPRQLPYVLC